MSIELFSRRSFVLPRKTKHITLYSCNFLKMVFCELCCCEYRDIMAHKKSASHAKGVTIHCDGCNEGFSNVRALRRHWKLDTTDCNFCKLCWEKSTDMKSHNKSNSHLRGVKFNCHDCGIGLSGPKALKRHYDKSTCTTPPTISQYRCCDCDLDYSSLAALRTHLDDERIHPPRAVKAVNLSLFCEKCDKEFKSPGGLKSHLASVKHNPLCEPFRCVGGNGCRKSFQSPSQMLSHFENGTCKSGMAWEKLDHLMIENDTTNIITEPDAFATRADFKEKILFALDFDDSSSVVSSADGGVGILTPTSTEDLSRGNSISSSNGPRPNFLLTPSEHTVDSDDEGSQATITRCASINSDYLDFDFNPRSGLTRHDSIGSNSSQTLFFSPTGILTPQSESDASGALALPEKEYSCRLCPERKKKFKTRQGLQAHLESQAHASKIYHCPVSFLLDIGGIDTEGSGIGKKKLKVKKFKTLSGVTQHIEAGACAGGKEAFGAVVEFVNEKLKVFELGDLKVVRGVQEVQAYDA